MQSLAKRVAKKNEPMKRGEKEAISLRRRRQIKNIVTFATVATVCVSVITTIYLWRNGSISKWIDNSETKVETLLVDAGLVVENVQVVGQSILSEEEILDASRIKSGDALLSVEIEEVIDRVEQLNWVKQATIRRDYSGNVLIRVQEHNAAAVWQVENKLWLVSDEGIRITDEKLEFFADLPMISGAGAENQLEKLIGAVSSNQALFDRVETASWVGGRRWDLFLKNGIKIMMPETGMDVAWESLSEFEQNEQLLARNILAVDFRVKDKTVVRLTPDEAARRRLLAKTSGKGKEI